MKILIYLLCLSSCFSYSRGLDQLIIARLNIKKAPLTKVLETIVSYSKYQPLIDQNLKGTTSLNLNRVSFKQALQTISKLHNLQISYMGRAIVITKAEKSTPIQKKAPITKALPNKKVQVSQFEDPQLQKIKKAFAFPPRVKIKRDLSLSQSEEQELQKILQEFSPKSKKIAKKPVFVKQTQLLGTTKSGSEYTAIIRYKGEERLCQVGSHLDANLQVKEIFEKHLEAFDSTLDKKVIISF
ncbi:MAG: STN domain-containing protein [Candidatus Cloacimonetes bacterium]|nr:STN domain-containing protein [Candidatus Cloacimonadota bacterium]